MNPILKYLEAPDLRSPNRKKSKASWLQAPRSQGARRRTGAPGRAAQRRIGIPAPDDVAGAFLSFMPCYPEIYVRLSCSTLLFSSLMTVTMIVMQRI